MKRLALIACLLVAGAAWALRSDEVTEQTENVQAIAGAWTAIKAKCTSDPCTGGRMAGFGHSIMAGYSCSGGWNDGFRVSLKTMLCAYGARTVQFVGSFTYPPSGSAIACPYTNGVPGHRISHVYDDLSALPTVMPTPTANDTVLIMALSNDAYAGASEAYMEAGMIACITKTASYGPALIVVCNDTNRTDCNMTNALQAASNAFTWARANGYNVKFADVNAAVPTNYLCADGIHLDSLGNSAAGDAIARALIY